MTYFRIQDKDFVAFGDINNEGFVNYISGNLKNILHEHWNIHRLINLCNNEGWDITLINMEK
jgi:hypothetical protein